MSNGVSSVTLYFNGAPNPNSFAASDVSLTTPNGPLPSGSISLTMLSSTSYPNLTASVSNQNYVAVSGIAPVLTAVGGGTNIFLNWQGLPGVSYQVYYSTDLINWLPYGSAATGSNGPIQILLPMGSNQMQFYDVQSSN